MKKRRTPHGKENAIQKPGHPDTNTARDGPVFLMRWRGIWGKLPPKSSVRLETEDAAKIVRANGNVTYSRNRPWWGMEPYMISCICPDRSTAKGGKSRRSCTYTTCISKFLPLYYIYYIPPQSLPEEADQRSAIHPRPPKPRTNPNGQAPRLAQTKTHIPFS